MNVVKTIKPAILFDTSVGSCNKGDEIIMQSCRRALAPILRDHFVITLPTHTPLAHGYQNSHRFGVGAYYGDAEWKFLCGTNILNANLLVPVPLWNLHLWNARYAKGTVCVGVGMGDERDRPTLYTRRFYASVLSKTFIHSTRDERTAEFLRGMGFRAVNTGCCTLWGLDEAFCRTIPPGKGRDVVFTLTDYKPDPVLDRRLVEILVQEYENVYFWTQGKGDFSYFQSLGDGLPVTVIPPSLEAYEELLRRPELDYVGTRLHGGIKAMQMGRRAVILSVDNRAEDMHRDFSLCILPRSAVETLPARLHEEFTASPRLHAEAIRTFLSQFTE